MAQETIKNNITHLVKTLGESGDSIVRITVNETATQGDGSLIQRWSLHKSINRSQHDTNYEVIINFAERLRDGFITAYYEICTEFVSGTVCCNPF